MGSTKFNNPNYELAMFDDLSFMMERLQKMENEFGLCRSMSGYSWPWVSKTDANLPDAIIDDVKMFWNRQSIDWINSTTDVTEMGCIHKVQGYDLNYSGIIFGEKITYDKNSKKIKIIKNNYHVLSLRFVCSVDKLIVEIPVGDNIFTPMREMYVKEIFNLCYAFR